MSKGKAIKKVAAGKGHIVFLLEDGTCMAMGNNRYGQLGDGTNVSKDDPVPVKGVEDCVDIAAGYDHTLFLLKDGTVKGAGSNWAHQLGKFGRIKIKNVKTPRLIHGVDGCTALAAGGRGSFFIFSDGTVSALGSNSRGELGLGRDVFKAVKPTLVPQVEHCVSIASTHINTLFLLEDGTVLGTGDNFHNQLGLNHVEMDDDEEISQVFEPVKIPGIEDCVDAAVGMFYTFFVQKDGTARMGGEKINPLTPPKVIPGIENCVKVDAGGSDFYYKEAIFLLKDGTYRFLSNEGPKTINDCVDVVAGLSDKIVLRKDGTCLLDTSPTKKIKIDFSAPDNKYLSIVKFDDECSEKDIDLSPIDKALDQAQGESMEA